MGYDRIEELDEALPPETFARLPLPWEAGFLAGECFVRYRRAGGTRRSPLPDFYIGAHAALVGMTLLTATPAGTGRTSRTRRHHAVEHHHRGRYGRAVTISSRFVVLALALYAACALWATWPAIRHVDGHYLARPAAGHGQAAAGDHLQLGWAFWLVGHQLERRESPLVDPYSFRPEAEAPPNLQGWLLGIPYWPLSAAVGDVWAYDLVVLLSFVLAGGLACWWLRALALSRPAALVGGLVFCLMPYRVGQSTGHLLGLVSFLLPAMLLALERRRFVLAAACLAALPLSGQLHLALGAIPLALGYAWARLPRATWWKAARRRGAAPLPPGCSSSDGRSPARSARAARSRRSSGTRPSSSDFVTRAVGSGVEELVFLGWLTPLVAIVGLAAVRRRRGLAVVLGLAALVPCLLALGGNLPGYETLWRVVPGPRLDPGPRAASCRSRASRSPPWSRFGIEQVTQRYLRSHAQRWPPSRRPPRSRRARASTCACRCSGRSPRTSRTGRTPRSEAPVACSSSPSSGPTSTSGAPTSATRARAPASGPRATRRSPRPRPTGSRGTSAASRAGGARSRRGSASAS